MKKLFIPMITKAINAYLGLDPESKQRLLPLKGRVATIELLPLHFTFQLELTEQGIEIHPDEALMAETKIIGTPLQMLGMMMNKDHRHRFFADDLKIEGNAELGQQLVGLFDELDIDWEEYLSHFVGDVSAHHASRVIRNISKWLSETEKTFTENINEYIHEEAEWFPTREALNDFFNDIDKLRMDLDRLEAKVKHLKIAEGSE
jgi:ubiquinone biosynthesis protein UbiJ